MSLELSALFALASACAPAVQSSTLVAIARVESSFDPLAIGVNGPIAASLRPRSATEAAKIAHAQISAGASVDLGLGQINSTNLEWLGLSIEDAFDPCRNLAAAGQVLRTNYAASIAEGLDPQPALRRALSLYNTGHPTRGFRNGYVAKVEAAAREVGAALALQVPPQPVEPPDTDPKGASQRSVVDWDVFATPSPIVVFGKGQRPPENGELP